MTVTVELDDDEQQRVIRALRTQMHMERDGGDDEEADAMADLWDKVSQQ